MKIWTDWQSNPDAGSGNFTVQSNIALGNPRFIWIIAIFALAIVGENAFGSSDTGSITSGFSANHSHIFYVGSALIGTAGLILLFPGANIKFPRFFMPYIVMTLFAMMSSFWGSAPIKSGGLSLILLLNLIWSSVIGLEFRKIDEANRFRIFVSMWTILFFINFTIENISKGFFANLDEFSMIAFILSFMMFRLGRHILSTIIFTAALSGQSFSAVLGFFLFIIVYYFDRLSKIGKFLILLLYAMLSIFLLQVNWIAFLEQRGITIFGKDSANLITGSGRFTAWQSVYDAIKEANWLQKLFGHGYATDRDVLTQTELSWAVDVHNNLLHIQYGLGLIGMTIFIVAIAKSMKLELLAQFNRYRLAILAAFLFFGFSSSYFFGRPSYMAVFWLTFLTAGLRSNSSPRQFMRRTTAVESLAPPGGN